MRIVGVLLIAILLLSFQDTTKNVVASTKDIADRQRDVDSLGVRMDTAYAGHLYRKATVLMDSGEYDLAIEKLTNASQILVSVLGESHDKLGEVYKDLGKSYMETHSFDQALRNYNESLKIKLEVYDEGHIELASIFNELGILYRKKGMLDEASEYHEKALNVKLSEYGELNASVATSYNNLAIIWNNKGYYQKSIECHERALDIRMKLEGENHSSVLASYINIGVVYSRMGEFEKSLRYYQKSLRLGLDILDGEHPYIVAIYINIGLLLNNKGDNILALSYLKKALTMSLKLFSEAHPYVEAVYNNLGMVEKDLGNYDQALEYYEKVLEVRESLYTNNHPAISSTYNNIGLVNKEQLDFAGAIRCYAKAIDIGRSFYSSNHPELLAFYNNMGVAHRDKGDFKMAREYFIKALDLLEYDVEDPYSFSKVNNLLILRNVLYNVRRQYELSYSMNGNEVNLDSLTYHYTIMHALESHMQKHYLTDMARLTYNQESLGFYERAICNLLRPGNENERSTAFLYSELTKSRYLGEKLKSESIELYRNVPNSLLEQEQELAIEIGYYERKKYQEKYESKLANDSLIDLYTGRIFQLENKRDALLTSLKRDFNDYYNLKFNEEILSARLIGERLLKKDQALLEYFVGDSSIFTFTILPDTFYVHRIKKDFPLDQWVGDMLHGIYDRHTNSADSKRQLTYTEATRNIYQKVFYHVDVLLPDGTDIIVIPDGILGYIPFDALITDSTKSNAYLIRDHQISYAYSATLQLEMENMQHDQNTKKKVLAFAPSFNHSDVVGDTTYLASRSIDVSNKRNWLSPLKYNGDEVRAIGELANADLFLDSSATKEQFLRHASEYNIIHLSTHGKANDKMGDYSFLAFYDLKDSTENWLYNRELYGIDLNADMVVLSACETGIGELQRGEGIISLARGFSYAGAKSIVTTLWGVNDRSTQKVMELFYTNLSEGMRKDEALREAKLTYLDEYPHLGTDPYFWAGIIPIGDMSQLEFDKGFNYLLWLGLILGLGALLWLVKGRKK